MHITSSRRDGRSHRLRSVLLGLSLGALNWIAPARAQTTPPDARPVAAATFSNPIRPEWGGDPWLVFRDGFYYYTATSGNEVQIAKARTLSELASAKPVTVWRRPDNGPNSRDIWAPELHFLAGKWYVYYSASNGQDASRRNFALEAQSADPQGAYTDRGQLVVPLEDEYAIDADVMERPGGKLYLLWSGRERSAGGAQNIYIAPMSDPVTVSGARVKLSAPTYEWETRGWAVNEGPEALQHEGRTFITYSASGGTTPDYCLGLLSLKGDDPLDAAAWTKSPVSVFSRYQGPDGAVYTPGHNGFFRSPDDSQDWIIYHGKENTDGTWGGRSARAQRFTWNADGSPNFGFPIPANVPLAAPAGEGPRSTLPRGAGTGLNADYVSFAEGQQPNFNAPKVSRRGEAVDFDWGMGSPSPQLGRDHFAARWRGQIQPRYSEVYAFQTFADDGVRVRVNGQLLVDDWRPHLAEGHRGFIALEAGRKYDIEMEYFESDNAARCTLNWSSPSQPFGPVPRSCLFPPAR